MSEIKDFDQKAAAIAEKKQKGPEFKLGGKEWKCVGYVPTGEYTTLFTDTQADDPLFLIEYLKTMVIPEQREDFYETLMDPEILIPVEVLSDIASYIGEEINKRPKKR